MGWAAIPNAITSSFTALHLPCGIAMPGTDAGASDLLTSEDRLQGDVFIQQQFTGIKQINKLGYNRRVYHCPQAAP